MADRRGRRLARGAAVALLVHASVIVAACGGDAAASAPPAGSTPADAAPTSIPTAGTNPGVDGPLVVDGQLLRILPASIAGIAMQPAPDSAAGMIGDAALAQAASAVAVAIVVAPGGSRGDDLAVSSVIQLRPGVYSDDFYRGWRDSYDRAACAQAGGVASHLQQLIGPHTVEVTVCSQGARTYHTTLPGDRLVSITAVGDRKFGDLVMGGLRQ